MLQLHFGDKKTFAIYLDLNLFFIDDRFCLKFHEVKKYRRYLTLIYA